MTSVSESDQERESNMSLTLGDIKAAAARILGKVHMTEVRTCDTINKMTGDKELFFKCEMWQKTGSFKARGKISFAFDYVKLK